jgi:alpha-tubulin suppressor-like RCC1 family protein
VPVKISMYKLNSDNEPQKTKQEILVVKAGFNHSLALSKNGKLFSWGYKGKGLLGRRVDSDTMGTALGVENLLPIRIGLTDFQKLQSERAAEAGIKNWMAKAGMNNAVAQDYTVKQVCCAFSNTMALTSTGNVYVLGDNTCGQHGKEELPKKSGAELEIIRKQDEENGKEMEFRSYSKVSLINFPTVDKIEYIACGGEHLFAKTTLDELYGWGRNDEGQVGVGFLTDKIINPMFIKKLSYKGIKQIACGDNYSAALTIYGEVYVAGSLEKGKLGLGRGQKRGYQLHFRGINDLPEIDFISAGVEHMLVISRYDPSNVKLTGKTFAWGKNHRG